MITPGHLAVVVGMDIDKAWRDQQALCIDFFSCRTGDGANLFNNAIDNFKIADIGFVASAIGDQAITNNQRCWFCHDVVSFYFELFCFWLCSAPPPSVG